MLLAIILALATAGLVLLRRRIRGRGSAWRTWVSIACPAVLGYWLMGFISRFGEPPAMAILPLPLWKLFMAVAGVFMLAPVIRAALETVLPTPKDGQRDDAQRR